jgi:hypothetical protein
MNKSTQTNKNKQKQKKKKKKTVSWPIYLLNPWFLFLMLVGVRKARTPYARRLAEAPGSFAYHVCVCLCGVCLFV